MPKSPNASFVQEVLHRPARVDHAIVRWRAKRARNDGQVASVIPYTGYGSTRWIRVLGRVLLTKEPWAVRRPGEPAGARGWRSFTSVPVEKAEVRVDVAGSAFSVTADRSGIVDAVVEVELPPGRHPIGLSVEGSAVSEAWVHVVADEVRVGVVSDIDDTVMVTALPRPLLAAWHTFVVNEHARSATPGMPVLYERLSGAYDRLPFVYLSTGAWNVAPTLTRFLSRNLYPSGALLLTDWGPTADRWFRSGQLHKKNSLERLAREFPDMKWLLIGDDGQHDEAIYSEFLGAHPDNVRAVCIRQLSPGEAVLAGSSRRSHTQRAEAAHVPWIYAPDGAGMAEELDRHGLLEREPQQPEVA